ncbi:hypothetical protein ACFVYF_24775 [Streptomyces sp. NPDC058274]|uniref:hypothetical protein n=1 Tax=Streptomyces sp. NPDC058274 TaxID=3346416 RepID=UPI0036E84122
MSPQTTALAEQIRRALTAAGFTVVGETEENAPGLRVSEDDSGVLVGWTASHGFEALADQSRGSDGADGADGSGTSDSMRTIVRAAVTALLNQLGYTVEEAPDGTAARVIPVVR